MHVEEIHIDGELDAIALEEFRFIDFLQNHDLAVRHGGNLLRTGRMVPFRDPEKGRLPDADPGHSRNHGAANPVLWHEKYHRNSYRHADQIDQRQGAV